MFDFALFVCIMMMLIACPSQNARFLLFECPSLHWSLDGFDPLDHGGIRFEFIRLLHHSIHGRELCNTDFSHFHHQGY